jgi:Reverse transcriptase (RNA-dependent DNA polymerase)
MLPHQPSRNVLRSHLVLQAKRDTAGAIIKYKFRPEVVYVRPPKILADRFGSKIMKLNKALYGLKQAPLSWHLYLEKMFDTVKIIKDPTPYLHAYNSFTIAFYVDDLIISDPNVEEVIELKNIIEGLFVCTDAGAMKEYLGVLFERRDDGAFVLSLRQYLLNVL